MTDALARLRADVAHGDVLRAIKEYDRLVPNRFESVLSTVNTPPYDRSVRELIEWRSSGSGDHRSSQEWEHGHQVLVWLDGLGSGLPVGHEDHAGGEDVVGHDPAVGVVGRHG